jgi:hypothetical protein
MQLPPGEYQLVAHSDSYDVVPPLAELKMVGVQVVVASTKTVEVRLVVKARVGAIMGNVIDVDGKPVTDAYVYVAPVGALGGVRTSWSGIDRPALTSTDGAFRIDGLAVGSYSVHAYRKGGGQAGADSVAVGTSTTLKMRHPVSIEGVVRHSGTPIVDLSIVVSYSSPRFHRREQFFRTDGRFALRDLPGGHLQLIAMADGLRASMELDVVEGETKTIAIDVAPHVTVTGRVVDLGTSTPVAGVEVVATLADMVATLANDTDPRSRTDAAGRFSIRDVPVGKISIFGWLKDKSDEVRASFSTKRTITSTIDVGDVSLVRWRIKANEWPGELGFQLVQTLNWMIASDLKLKVSSIDPLGPAARSGLEVGDIITSIDGHDVQGENAYVGKLLHAPAGTRLRLGVARGASVSITLAPRKSP